MIFFYMIPTSITCVGGLLWYYYTLNIEKPLLRRVRNLSKNNVVSSPNNFCRQNFEIFHDSNF